MDGCSVLVETSELGEAFVLSAIFASVVDLIVNSRLTAELLPDDNVDDAVVLALAARN